MKDFIGQRFEREAKLDTRSLDTEKRTVELSFSSEEPIERFFGMEVLDHQPGSVRLGRLNNKAPLLVNHDADQLAGVVERASVGTDKKGRATVRFSQNARAQEVFQDVKDNILTSVSVGYRIFDVAKEETDPGVITFRATDWEPLEISLVSVPADATIGVGRSLPKRTYTMEQLEQDERTWSDAEKEHYRVKEMLALGDQHKCQDEARTAINEKWSVNKMKKLILENYRSIEPTGQFSGPQALGMSPRETRKYSLAAAIRGLLSKDWAGCGMELEASRALVKQRGKDTSGLIIPFEVLTRTVTKAGAGGNLIGTEHRPDLFVDVLRSRSMLTRLGATVLPNLMGDVSIPRKTTPTGSGWVAEGAAAAESTPVPDAITLAPETVSGWTRFTRKMVLQSSPGIEQMMEQDLTATLGTALDVAGINGSGTGNQPLGILNLVGIPTHPLGTDGALPTWDDVVALETLVGAANADDGQLAYLTNSAVRGTLKATEKATGTAMFVWPDTPLVDGLSNMNSYPAGVSNNVPSNLTKGTGTALSAMIYGNFADLLIGLWGNGVELLTDPFTESTLGNVRVIAMLDADIGVRHIESFAVIVDCITA